MEHINSFSGGMNKDISKSLFKEGAYIDALNLSLITDVGLSTASLRNIKGNEWFIDVPSCSNVVRLSNLTPGSVVVQVISGGINFTVNTSAATIAELGLILSLDPRFAANNLAVAYTNTSIVIYGTLVNNLLVNPLISVNAANIQVDNNHVPAFGLLKILGWVLVRDQIVLYTTDNSDEEPVNKYGQIWNLTYDKHTEVASIKLIYNGALNFSLYHPIANPGATVGNYETPEIQKIYFTDNYNKPKFLNIADPQAMALEVSQLEILADLVKSVSTISEINGGGNIKTGLYQVSARLTKINGGTSLFLPASNPIPIINEQEGPSVSMLRYEARDTGVLVAKTIKGTIFNIDQNYDRIEPCIIYKETADSAASVFILPGEPIPSLGVYSFTYTGNETTIELSLEEFVAERLDFDTVKTMASKNNMMFFGNVKYADFDVDFDARAYRFTNNDGNNQVIASLKTSSGVIQYQLIGGAGNTPNWDQVLENADAIQSHNDQAPDGKNKYLWQADGTTFGGEGKWVKYEFVPMNSFNDNSINRAYRTPLDLKGPLSFGSYSAPYASVPIANATIDFNGSTVDVYDQVNQYNSYFNASSPYVSYGLKGYRRDEMYRFGIVFYSKKGQPSYVHWVGDIRMPKPYMPSILAGSALANRDYISFPICSMDNGSATSTNDPTALTTGTLRNYYGNNLGIKFTVDVSSIKDQISGFSIVRVVRKDYDRTVLDQGMLTPAWFSGTKFYSVPGGLEANWRNCPTDPAYANSGTWDPFTCALASPEYLFKNNYSFNQGDQIDIIQVNQSHNGSNDTGISENGGVRTQGLFNKHYILYPGASTPKNLNTPITLENTFNLDKGSTIGINWSGYSTGYSFVNTPWEEDIASGPGGVSGYYIAATSGGTKTPRSVGGTRLAMSFNRVGGGPNLNSLSLPGYPTFSDVAYSLDKTKNTTTTTGGADPTSGECEAIYIANYKRPGTIQYGGNSYAQRSYNEYISTGHVQLVDSTSVSQTYTSMVFGGDTYITLFDYADQLRNSAVYGKTFYRPGPGSNSSTQYSDTRYKINLMGVECSFPIELRKNNEKPAGTTDDGYTSDYRCAPNKAYVYGGWPNFITGGAGPRTTAEWTEAFELELSYFGDSAVSKYFTKPDPIVEQKEFDVRVHRSQIKTNGELVESWGVFKPDEYIDVDTSQGSLNNLIIYQNYLIGFQERGIVQLSVKDRAITPDISGSEIILGTAGILENYTYISKIIGTRHQLGFTTSHDSIFWFDMNTKNMYKMSGQSPIAITVAKGMSSYMNNNLDGIVQISDNPLLDRGIAATYDFRYNEAIMTFKDSVRTIDPPATGTVIVNVSGSIYNINTVPLPIWITSLSNPLVVVYINGSPIPHTGVISSVISNTSLNIQFDTNPIIPLGSTVYIYSYNKKSFTVAYNDTIDAYTSFYSFTPGVYINDQSAIFSPDSSLNRIFRHDIGAHGVFYNPPGSIGIPNKSTVKMIVNPYPLDTKVFDNYEMVTEVIDLTTGANIVDDTFSRIRLYDDYQNSDFQDLPIDILTLKDTAKRKERTWNISNLRNRVLYYDYNSPLVPVPSPDIFNPIYLSTTDPAINGDKLFGERFRDKYLTVDLEYDNSNNRRLVLHSFKTNYRKSAR